MSSLTLHRPHVQIPRDSDGYLVPRLLPVAAYLCCEEYDDAARSRILERLADGVSPRDCARDGLIEWRDLDEIEALTAGAARPYLAPLPPISGAAPAPAVACDLTDAEWDAMCAANDAEMDRLDADRPGPDGHSEADEAWAAEPDDDGPYAFPRLKSAADRRADMAAVLDWFACHPGE